ncbi:FIG4 [Candida theae]|uniref:FIG4 n=1 Tax=Candida theae TaxID=1198502 RepID=A0AAD5FZM4_9ASCO|nr:FIG4 [Candida theae]KAI5961339.1 FIG4 [Candida theae]
MSNQDSTSATDQGIKNDIITASMDDIPGTLHNQASVLEEGIQDDNAVTSENANNNDGDDGGDDVDDDDDDDDDEEEQGEGGSERTRPYKRILLQRFTVYNSSSTMYIVGSNAKESLYRILEISKDVEDEQSLSIIEDKSYFYTRKDMIELLNGLNDSVEGGLHKLAQGFGLLGLVRFTKGYYLNLITKCSQVAILGGHFIYHIDETKLIPLGTNYKRPEKYSDEEKLLSLYRYMDLSKTFYFSYNYDITNSMQTNFMRHKLHNVCGDKNAKIQNKLYANFDCDERFVWNNLLLKPVLESEEVATFEWFQPVVHGFIDQANISIYGRKFYITIIARRSHHFAGTRFLKRGIDDKGNVANEIETEQIVSDMLTSSFHDPKYGMYSNPRYTSFVQHRGSIPLFWTQDMNKLPKPPIQVNLPDPFYQSSALHFDNLFYRYGSPIIILNLIKQKEKQPRESRLNVQYINCVNYLNQFLPEQNQLRYKSFDMSKNSKKNMDVITPLQNIAHGAINQIGIFHNGTTINSTRLQKGVIRTNCIDCLDRTNAAQFIICKEALTIQLRSLQLISEGKTLDYESDLINILTEIFHDHGDTIAIQYGGSNLVNTMDSYRRINQWSSHTRDMLNSIKRMYSNSFMDSIRQEAINLFLGNYTYSLDKPKLWELSNDFGLHFDFDLEMKGKRSYTHWFDRDNLRNERFEIKVDEGKGKNLNRKEGVDHRSDSGDKWYNELYVPRKYQSLTELFQFNMNSNSRYFPSVSSLQHQQVQPQPQMNSRQMSKQKSQSQSQSQQQLQSGIQSQVKQSTAEDLSIQFDYSPFESRKSKHSDKAVGGEEISYLEHHLNTENVDGGSENGAKQVRRSASGKYNPKNIKTFLASKITARQSAKKKSQSGNHAHNVNSPVSDKKDGGRYDDDDNNDDEKTLVSPIEPKVDDSDAKLYQAQFDLSKLTKTLPIYNYASYCSYKSTRLKPSFQDQEIYKSSCRENLDSTGDGGGDGGGASASAGGRLLHNLDNRSLRSSFVDMVNTQDLKTYLQYINDEEKLLELETDHNYI